MCPADEALQAICWFDSSHPPCNGGCSLTVRQRIVTPPKNRGFFTRAHSFSFGFVWFSLVFFGLSFGLISFWAARPIRPYTQKQVAVAQW